MFFCCSCHEAHIAYGIMYYKNSNTIGIRRRFGTKHQVFGFGGTKINLGEKELREHGEEAVRRLQRGQSETEVSTWVRKLVNEA